MPCKLLIDYQKLVKNDPGGKFFKLPKLTSTCKKRCRYKNTKLLKFNKQKTWVWGA